MEFDLTLDDSERLAELGRALSVPARIQILKVLCHGELNVNEIAQKLEIATSSAASHVNALAAAGLVETRLKAATRGSMKICSLTARGVHIDLSTAMGEVRTKVISMPVGQYTDYQVTPTCGLAGPEGPIGTEDSPNSYYSPERVHATLLWFCGGYVEYRFPNDVLDGTEDSVEFSMELCSEDHEYNLDHKSDITLWVNGVEAGTWRCPSDFGGRRGKYNPSWWPDKNTQYGKLKVWRLTPTGTYLDGKKISNHRMGEYRLDAREYISLRIGLKEDSKYNGGVNLFGEGFGDYPQTIQMKIVYGDQ